MRGRGSKLELAAVGVFTLLWVGAGIATAVFFLKPVPVLVEGSAPAATVAVSSDGGVLVDGAPVAVSDLAGAVTGSWRLEVEPGAPIPSVRAVLDALEAPDGGAADAP